MFTGLKLYVIGNTHLGGDSWTETHPAPVPQSVPRAAAPHPASVQGVLDDVVYSGDGEGEGHLGVSISDGGLPSLYRA